MDSESASRKTRTREIVSKAEFGSDVAVDLIKALGIEYVAFNPGATFRGLHDSIVNYGGNTSPEVIQCTHEEIAVAIAHGYAKATGKPMLTIAHNIVGLLHASMAIFNAWCDRAPMMVLGGTGPNDTTTRRPWIDWIHTGLIQGNLVRDYVKWDDQPASVASVPESLIRGYQVATTEPKAPVYINFDATIQDERLTEPFVLPDVSRYAQPSKLQADPAALDEIAGWLVEADSPVILVELMGRNPEMMPVLVELAELVGCPVLDRAGRMNFPSTHPLDVSGDNVAYLSNADFILGLDINDLYGNLTRRDGETLKSSTFVRPDVKIAHIWLGDLLIRSLVNDFQRIQETDLSVLADTSLALPDLLERCRRRLTGDGAAENRIDARAKVTAKRHAELRRGFQEAAASHAAEVPIHPAHLANETWEVLKDEEWVLVSGMLGGWPRKLWAWEEQNCYLGTGSGGGLGYGLGATMGASLGLRGTGKIAVTFESDGDFLFTPSALWTAAHHKIPSLTIMYNNRSYYNSEEHGGAVARHRKRPVENAGIGTVIRDPDVDFAAQARAYGLWGEGPIEDPAEVRPAIERALKVVREEGRLALVDVVCGNEDRGR